MHSRHRSGLVVTHDSYFAASFPTRALRIEAGTVRSYPLGCTALSLPRDLTTATAPVYC